MAILHVRGVPDELYERLKQRAAAERRSLSAEVVALLEQATDTPPPSAAAILDRATRIREELRRQYGEFPSSVELLRQDRAR